MALITSAASGNFSSGATWTGGVVPGATDEARASTGHTVTIDASVTVTTISISGTGKFQLNDGVILTGTINGSGTSAASVVFGLASPASATIVGFLNGGAGQNTVCVETTSGSSGTLNITGNSSNRTIMHRGSGILNLNGSISVSAASGSTTGIQVTSSGILNVNGNVTGGVSTNQGIQINTNGIANITGNVTGGSGDVAILNSSTGTLNVTGNVTAGNVAAIQSILGGTLKVSGSIISAVDGRLPIYATKMLASPQPTLAKTRYALSGAGTYVDFFTADNTGLAPAVTDVRAGVVYGSATGVLAVPSANSVAFGVPVDNTTGTALLTGASVASAVWGAATSSLTTSGSIGDRIKNCATVESTGEQLAAAMNAP